MGISLLHIKILKQLLEQIPIQPVSMISLGYPDALVTVEAVKSIFGPDVLGHPIYRDDSEKIKKWHGVQSHINNVLDTQYLMHELGIDMTVIDIAEVRGGEVICDLNKSMSNELSNRFDIVLDGGTLEHCFNVGQAITNLLSFAKTDGFIFHCNPLCMINHGFFNFSPTFYHDFYSDNGHRLVSPIYCGTKRGLDHEIVKLPNTERLNSVAQESTIWVVAQKTHDRPVIWPMQTKYKKY